MCNVQYVKNLLKLICIYVGILCLHMTDPWMEKMLANRFLIAKFLNVIVNRVLNTSWWVLPKINFFNVLIKMHKHCKLLYNKVNKSCNVWYFFVKGAYDSEKHDQIGRVLIWANLLMFLPMSSANEEKEKIDW